jgi:hypothetical protein
MAGLNQEIWTDVLVKDFKGSEAESFLNLIPDESRHVAGTKGENEVIHLVDVGADPEVLVNNITYPIGVVTQVDGDIAISLDTFVTKATKVSQEEIENITYDKISLVQEKHKNSIMNTKHIKAVHALAPVTNKTATPVLVTTGPVNTDTGMKRLLLRDIRTLKKKFGTLGIPTKGRVLVLTEEHHDDLLEDCAVQKKSDSHLSTDDKGEIQKLLYSFKTYIYLDTPYFTLATKAKLSYGAIPVAGDVQASVAFNANDMFRASGLTKNYTDEPTTQNHAWLYNVRHNYVVLPRKERAIAAIISAAA